MRRLTGLATSLCLFLPVIAQAEVSLGLAKDNDWSSSEHIARMEAYGLTDHGTIYYKLMSDANRTNPYDWVEQNYLDAGIDTLMVLIIDDGARSTVGTSEGTDVSAGVPGLMEQVSRGDFDEALIELATEIRMDGRDITIRPFHEIDGGWYQWGIYADGNSADLAVSAVEHVIDVFEAVGTTNVTWEINFNRRDGRGEVLGEAEYLIPALEAVGVTQWSVSTYNRCGTSARYDEERSFADDFGPIYDRIAALSELPINVAEVSTSGLCAPKTPWFEEMLVSLDQRFPRTQEVTFFFGIVPIGKASNVVPIYWGYDQSFLGLQQFRELMDARRLVENEEVHVAPLSQPPVRQAPPATVSPQRTAAPVRVAPVVRTEEVQVVPTRGPLGFSSTPWSAWGRLSLPLVEEGNPALNPVTGNEFGETGPLFRWTLTQKALWDEGSFEHGPGLHFGGVHSLNDDQWWNNSVDVGLTYGFYWDAPRRGSVDWGGWSAELYGGRRQYLVSVPERYEGDGEWMLGLNFTYSLGGDHSQ